MDFYYDPIIGLQYTSNPFFEISIDDIPKNIMSFEHAINLVKEMGVQIIDSSKSEKAWVRYIPMITTNAITSFN